MEEYVDYNERKIKIMSAGDVLDYSLELYKKNFKQIFLVVGIFNIPIFIVLGFFFTDIIDGLTYFFGNGLLQFMSEEIDFYTDMNFFLAVALFLHFTIFQMIIDFLVINIIYNDILFEKKISTFTFIKKAILSMHMLFINKLIFWILSFTVSLIILLILTFVTTLLFTTLSMPSVFLSGNIGSIYLAVVSLIEAIILYVVFSICIYPLLRTSLGKVIVSVERKNGLSAYAKSLFVGGKCSHIHIFASGLLGIILISFIVLAVLFVFLIFSALLTNFVVSIKETLLAVSSFIGFIACFFIYPLFWVIYTVSYVNLIVKNEGLDLELYIEKLHAKQRMSNT